MDIIINLGGNNLLLDKMDSVTEYLNTLHRLFPDAYFCTVPSVNDAILSEISQSIPIHHDATYYHNGVIALNNMIIVEFHPRIIDLYSLTLDPATGEENPLGFKDMVHFNDYCFRKLVVPIENLTS